jgi:hypothetical protein
LAEENDEGTIFPYRLEWKYSAILMPAIIIVPVITSVIYYYVILPDWEGHSVQHFQNIKQVLVRYGNLSSKESDSFSNNNISSSRNSYAKEAVRLAQLDLSGLNILLKLILPLVVVLSLYILFSLRLWIPGVNKHINKKNKKSKRNYWKLPHHNLTLRSWILLMTIIKLLFQ